MEKIQAALIETERLGERFLDVRQKAVALDRQRQENREALTAFRKQPSAQHKAWMRLRGGILVKFHMQQAKDVLQAEQDSIEHELTQIRAEEKRLIGLLSEKGAGPQVSEGTLAAMLKLEDRQRTKR
uniref:P53 and DNA damage-regulated protein 1 n=1 Tax=Dunaliella tertiolecta TaxID=3047 RepID=A0A7S3VGL4_DUNTE|mmetsp:Transcript_8043/g.21429  ORF Transcript_8043/g.21429 Transcript_8043/m.21429 type:complete len:127 (+) Transcript_8043:46-426(+)